jgi:aminopeptidase N
LRESVNEYLAWMFIEHYWGADSLSKCMRMAEAYYKGYVTDSTERPLMEITQNFKNSEDAIVVYYKGPLIVNELRKALGDENWSRFIQEFYSDYKGKFATYNDFLSILSRYDPGHSITDKLNYRLTSKGLPEN